MNFDFNEYIDKLMSSEPTPGGGSVSSLVASLVSSLLVMVSEVSKKGTTEDKNKQLLNKNIKLFKDIAKELLELRVEDEKSYLELSTILKKDKEAPQRNEELENALIKCAKVPLELEYKINDIFYALSDITPIVKKSIISDLGIALSLSRSLLDCAIFTVYANTNYIKDENIKSKINSDANNIYISANNIYTSLYPDIVKKIGVGEF